MPDWLTLDNVEKSATISAILIGGIWVYYNFFRGRTYKARFEPAISARLIDRGGHSYLVVRATLRNTGLTNITIQSEGTGIRVLNYNSDESSVAPYLVGQERLGTFSAFQEHHWVEPGKGIDDEFLVGLPDNIKWLIRVELRVVANGVECKTATIVGGFFTSEVSS